MKAQPRTQGASTSLQFRCRCGYGGSGFAAACPSCGTPLRVVKDRSIAILLAVLLSFVSWTYTYARNWPKFWLGLVATLVGSLLALKSSSAALLTASVWIWAIVDNATKPTEYYLRYPEPWKRYRPGPF